MFNTLQTFDQIVHSWFLLMRSDALTAFFTFITEFGNWKIVLPAMLCATAILYIRNKRHAYVLPLWISLVCASAITYLLKILIARPRPLENLVVENSFSFPSLHATVAVAVYGLLLYLSCKNAQSLFVKNIFILTGLTLILLVGVSRLYLGVHYVSDVFVGYVVGCLGIFVGISLHATFAKSRFM